MPFKETAALMTSLRPASLADVETVFITGQLSFSDRSFSSISVCSFALISLLFNATTTGIPSSSSCVVKKRLLLRFVASTIFTMASGFSCLTNPLVILSSGVNGDIEYAPGRSTATSSSEVPANSDFMSLSFIPTVTPAQLPTRSFLPVSALNIVVLPLLGLPAKAILILYPPQIIALYITLLVNMN